MTSSIQLVSHPAIDALDAAAFETALPADLGTIASPDWLTGLLHPGADAPLRREERVRSAVRDMLRLGGYKPTGRGKPASEYLVGAAESGRLGPINPVVDACNAASLHSGLPISVIDLDLAHGPLSIAVPAPSTRYVFNASGQEIDVGGLVSLHDSAGPCAGPVKDSQRTKTRAETRRVLSLVWGVAAERGLAASAASWQRELLERLGATTRDATLS